MKKNLVLSMSLLFSFFVVIAQNVGVGTLTPHTHALLHVDIGASTTKGLLTSGIYNPVSTIPDLGAGSRMMFYPGKVAFRVGYTDGTQWNNSNVGQFSVGMGYGTTASGYGSLALGRFTQATNSYATAIGYGSVASGTISTAMGQLTTASGNYSTSIGQNTSATGVGSIALGQDTEASGLLSTAMGFSTSAADAVATSIGQYTTASGQISTAMGNRTTASGHMSTSMGRKTTASGLMATAIGDSTTAYGTSSFASGEATLAIGTGSTTMGFSSVAGGSYSTAMGRSTAAGHYTTSMGYVSKASGYAATSMGGFTSASGYHSNTMGYHTIAKGFASTVVGQYNDSMFLVDHISVYPTTPLFIVGNGSTNASRSNAMVVLKNGYVGIGDNTPTNPLSFPPVLGKKISLYPGATGDAGFAIQGNQLLIYSDNPNSNVRLGYDQGGVFTNNLDVYGNGNAWLRGTLTQNSDIRLKRDIHQIENALALIMQLNGYQYHWKNKKMDPAIQSGLIAQEIRKVFPQLVKEDAEGILSVNYTGLIPYMIEAAKEQQQQVDNLKSENQELKRRLDRIEKLMVKQ